MLGWVLFSYVYFMQDQNNLHFKFLNERYLIGFQEISIRFLFGIFGGSILSILLYQHVEFLHLVSWNIASLFLAFFSYFILKKDLKSGLQSSVKDLRKWESKLWVVALLWAFLWGLLPFLLPGNAPVNITYTVLVIFILMTSTPTVGIGLFAPQYIAFFSSPFLSLAYYVYQSPLFIGWFFIIVVLSAWLVLAGYFIMLLHIHKSHLLLNIKYKQAKKIAEEERANQAHLMSTVTHDLRQPSQALNLFLSAIDKEDLSEANQHLVQKLQSSTDALNGLLNHVLDLSLLESGNISVELSVFDVQSVIQPLVAQFDVQARKKGLSLYCDHESYWVKTDLVLLKRILSNLLDNAIAYTQQGNVEIRLIEEEFQLAIHVNDTGIGISEHQCNSIFDPYYQIEKDISVRSKHVGLGLSIVKQLSDLLRLTLSVESQENQGSKFTVTLDQVDTVGRSLVLEKSDSLWNLSDVAMLVIDPDENCELAFLLASWRANIMLAQSVDESRQVLRKSLLKPAVVLIDDALLGDVIEDISILHSNSVQPLYIILGDQRSTSAFHDAEQLPKPLKPMQLRTLIQRKLNE